MQREILWEGDTTFGHYIVADGPYSGRPARVLYGGSHQAAQSGLAKDDKPDLLFDYNQRLLELAQHLQPARILLIGGGAGTLPAALLPALPETRVDVVELDEGLTQLGYRFFDLPVDERLCVFHADGRTYLENNRQTYNLILVDAFMDNTIPRELKTAEAFQTYAGRLAADGVFAMNIISAYNGRGSHVLRAAQAAAAQSFPVVGLFLAGRGDSLWLPQNFLLVAQKAARLQLQEYLRYSIDQLQNVHRDEALHD